MKLNREVAWRMFVLAPLESDQVFRHWIEFANIDLPEVPLVGHRYHLGEKRDPEWYRVAWSDPYHQHFGVVFEKESTREMVQDGG